MRSCERTDTGLNPSPARNFALRLAGWWLGLFGLLRLPWIEAHALLPLTQWQSAVAGALLGPATLPIEATLACSGADALALCFATILAYPATWRARANGIAIGAASILALNTVRIATLGHASPRWFNALHFYIWPAILTVAIAAIVWTWMVTADRPGAPAGAPPTPRSLPRLSLRFAIAAVCGLVLFTVAGPLYLESPRVLAFAALIARAAAFLLRGAGVTATASAGILSTPSGAFLVTQECIATPLIPIYLAAVLVHVRPWPRAALWTAIGVPVFALIGIARLLVVAIPAGLDRPPAFLVHAFSQLLVAAGVVCSAALWRHGARLSTAARITIALAVAIAFVVGLGAPYTRAILTFGTPDADPQGAIAFLPAFQCGLFLALWIAAFSDRGWSRFLAGAAALATLQVAVATTVRFLAVHAGIAPLVRDVRAWAIVAPALIIAAVVHRAPARR
jgi:exosortase/archaeosortase family protein